MATPPPPLGRRRPSAPRWAARSAGSIGGALGAVGGAVVDSLLINALTSRKQRAPQLDTIAITNAAEGTPVRKLWGRMRLGGNVIWCTQFNSYTTKEKTASVGQGLRRLEQDQGHPLHAELRGGLLRRRRPRAARPRLGRRQRARPSQIHHAFYNGCESQLPDAFIEIDRGHAATCRPIAAPATSSSTT